MRCCPIKGGVFTNIFKYLQMKHRFVRLFYDKKYNNKYIAFISKHVKGPMRECVYITAVKSGGEIIASFLKETTSGKKYSNSDRNKNSR